LSLIRGTYLRFQVLVHEIGKFGIVGIVGAIVQFGLQNALYGRTGPTASVVIATCTATTVTFLGNRYWAFEHRKTANVGRETVLFFFFNLVGMLIQTAFVDADHYWLHDTGRLSYNLATVIGVVFATLFRLFCYRRFVFNLVPSAPVGEMAELETVLLYEMSSLSAERCPWIASREGSSRWCCPG
jgi:putative flippase GtrA